MKNELAKRFGEHRVHDVPVKEGDMPLLMLDLELRSPINILMTNGLSDYNMPVPEKEEGNEFNELCFCLPSYWNWEEADNPQMNWVFTWIQKLAKYVQENKTWFGHGHTFPNGKEMNPISATMAQNNFIMIRPMLLETQMAPVKVNGKTVNFLFIVPIYEEELDFKQSKGTRKFITKFINKGVNEMLDDYRVNALKRKWSFVKQ
ncbi:MAG: suppressor of fused domain protein [Crocinitomicaceae bacterium]|nr:suppressor of fused domain protein [Crocinitomicaceae bacterium]